MKRTTAMLLLLCLLLTVTGCAKEEPENPYQLKTKTYRNYYDGEVTETSYTYAYDEEGLKVSSVESSSGEITRYTYDEYGNHIRTEIQGPDGTNVISERVLTLDEEHRPVRSEHYWNGELQSVTEYGYDEYGNEAKLNTTLFNLGTTVESQITRKYDRDGNLLREETTGSTSSYIVYEYKDGHLCASATYDMEGTVQRSTQVTWDEASRTETSRNYTQNGTANGYIVRTFDEYGNCLKEEIYQGPDYPMGGGDDLVDSEIIHTYERIPE